MTQDPNTVLADHLQTAQQAIHDFDLAEGLEVTAQLQADPPALSLLGRSAHGALEYLASADDLQDEGSSWFIRRALRSLNDRHNAGHLPDGEQPEREYLRPLNRYELDGNEVG
jgi:hypothetical protein